MAKAKIPEPKDVKKMFWLGVGALAIGCAIVAILDRYCVPPAPSKDGFPPPIAKAGEWVTHPDGTRICRLLFPIYPNQVVEPSFCEDWQERIPYRGMQVDFLRSSPWRGGQTNIEGKWRP